MAISFGISYGRDLPDQGQIALGSIIPRIPNRDALGQAVAAAGAVIMPHNFYLHSGLVCSREVNRKSRSALRDANFYTTVEGNIALAISFLISLVVIAVFGNGLHGATNRDVHTLCTETNERQWWIEQFNCS